MEGLEAAEVFASKALQGTSTKRIDPEYFQRQHLKDEALLTTRCDEFSSFEQLGIDIDASAFYPSIEGYYGEGNFPFLRVADVDSVIDFNSCTRIPEKLCDKYPTLSRVGPGDILFTKGGSVARVGLVTEPAAVSRDLIFLNSSKLPVEDQAFLYLYFQTSFFHRKLLRSSSQTAQPHLTITLVRELKILSAGQRLKKLSLDFVKKAFAIRDKAIQYQKEAETTLLRALGLENWQAPEPLSYVRNSRDAFAAGRLDAEYFTPQVTIMLAKLGADNLTIADVAPARHKKFKPDEAGNTFRYIEIGGVRNDGTVEASEIPTVEAPSRATQHVLSGDVITSTVRPIRRLSALISDEQNGDVCSSGFVVLRPISVSGSTLLIYLRLLPVCQLMDLHTSASLYPAISEKDLLALPIPRIDVDVQKEIDTQVEDARKAKQQATQLLDAAKRAIEIAIEESEDAALAYLDDFGV